MELRPYQSEAVECATAALARGEHPVIALSTGAGKSLVAAEIARRYYEKGLRVLVVTHVQELVESNAREFEKLTGVVPGVLCAGLESYDKEHDVLYASVQSIYSPSRRGEINQFALIIVDEADMVAEKAADAKFYPTLFTAHPESQRLGLTATPYRLDGGEIYGEGRYFTHCVYETDIMKLIEDGYLAPLVGVNTRMRVDRRMLSTVAGDFVMSEVSLQEDEEWLRKVVASVQDLASERKHVAVFCPSVDTAELAARMFTLAGWPADFVVADTEERGEKLERWKAGELRVMCSVNVLYRGFNFPALDCLVGLRPTQSKSLHVQMLGRGLRTAPGKRNCLVLDYAGNLLAHGGVAAGAKEMYDEAPLPGGAHVRVSAEPRPELVATLKRANQVTDLSDIDPLIGTHTGAQAEVLDVKYIVIPSGQRKSLRLLMASYKCELRGAVFDAKQFICVEHGAGFALQQAAQWFARRGRSEFPRNAERAQAVCYALPVPRKVQVRRVGKYLNVVGEVF